MKLYVAKRPDGTLVEMQPQKLERACFGEAASQDGEPLDKRTGLFAAVTRATSEVVLPDANTWNRAAAEIAPLMGYTAVEVVCVERDFRSTDDRLMRMAAAEIERIPKLLEERDKARELLGELVTWYATHEYVDVFPQYLLDRAKELGLCPMKR
jgi:hypothetical protein